MKKIVLYIGTIYFPDKSASAQRAFSLSKSFENLGYHMIIVGMNKTPEKHKNIVETKQEYEGFETYTISQPKRIIEWVNHTLSISNYIELIESIGKEKIHSIIMMEYEAIPLLKMANYCKNNNINIIADVEEWYDKSRLKFPINIVKNIDTYIRMKYVYPYKINNMICISRFFYEYYKNTVKNRVYIPGTIDPNNKKWKCIPKYNENNILTLGYAGYPGVKFEKERLDLLIEAILELNEEGVKCKLNIAGIKKENLLKILNKKFNEEIINCLGSIEHKMCLSMIAKCDFTIIVREPKINTNAGFPTKLSESFACCTPCITTNVSNVYEYIIFKKTGIIIEGYDKKGIKKAIRQVSNLSTEEIKEMHEYLYKNNPLTYSKFNDDLEEFINNIKNKNERKFYERKI